MTERKEDQMSVKKGCMDCGGALPERPVIVVIEEEAKRYCSSGCAAGALGELDPGSCCVSNPPEHLRREPDAR